MMKKILHIVIWTVLTVGLFILLGFSSLRHKNIVCKHYEILIDYNNTDTFLKISDIENELLASGYSIIDKTLKEINTNKIEEHLIKDPYIKDADVFSTVEGNIQINIVQRTPLVRIINKNNNSYYIDSEGSLMPLSNKATSRVLIANGNIKDGYSASINLSGNHENMIKEDKPSDNLQNIYYLATYIDHDEFMKSVIDQIYIRKNNEIELIPKVGNQLITFGKIDDLEVKFKKLKALYKEGFRKTGWSQYKTINLKYKNQVVCSKK